MNILKKNTGAAGRIAVFEDKTIRCIFHNGEWYSSIIDIIRVLTDSSDPNRYWPELKKKLIVDEGVSQLLDKIEQLKSPRRIIWAS